MFMACHSDVTSLLPLHRWLMTQHPTAADMWNSWSANSKATGPLLFVNYGTMGDWAALGPDVNATRCLVIVILSFKNNSPQQADHMKHI